MQHNEAIEAKKTKFTPGPWTNSIAGITDSNGNIIAQCWHSLKMGNFKPMYPSHAEWLANREII